MERKEKRDRECVDECACLHASVGVISATRHANVGKNMLTKVKSSLPRRERGYGEGKLDDGRREVLTAEGSVDG